MPVQDVPETPEMPDTLVGMDGITRHPASMVARSAVVQVKAAEVPLSHHMEIPVPLAAGETPVQAELAATITTVVQRSVLQGWTVRVDLGVIPES